MNKIIIAIIFFCILYMLIKGLGEYIGFGVNKTNSQTPGVYVYFPIKYPLKIGDLVDCYLDYSDLKLKWIKSTNYIQKGQKLLKNIGGTPGHFLYTFYPNVYLCNKKYFSKNCVILGSCMKKDKNGFALYCQNWNGFKIPENYFYLQSNRVLNSFDSRYLGLVNIKNIKHKLRMILEF